MCPALASSGFMKIPCSVLQCGVLCSPGVSEVCLCVLCASTIVANLLLPFVQSSTMAPLSVMGRFGSCVVSGQIWAHLGLELSQTSDQLFARDAVRGHFSCVVS